MSRLLICVTCELSIRSRSRFQLRLRLQLGDSHDSGSVVESVSGCSLATVSIQDLFESVWDQY